MNTLSFAQDDSGAWGYIVGGADTVNPFKIGDYTQEQYDAAYQNGYNKGKTDGRIKSQKGSFNYSCGKGGDEGGTAWYTKTVNFPEPFTAVPSVSVECSTKSMTWQVSNITKLGCTIRVGNTIWNNYNSGTANWIAAIV